MQKVLIIGIGLIGGSIFKRLTEIHQEGERVYDVTIYDPYMSEDNMESFINYCRSIDIEPKQYNPADFQENLFDIAIVATPPSDNVRIHLEFELQIFTLALHVCDVSSVKNWISKWCDNNNFTSVHIMAGSEKTGFINSKADLHKGGNTVIFTKYNNIDRLYCYMPYCLMIIMWQDIVENAQITIQPSTCDTLKLHDKIVAWTSHFPQLFCFALNDIINKEHDTELNNALQQISQDWVEHEYLQKNLFRLCQSNRVLWKSIFKQNSENLLNILKMHDMGYDFSLFKPVKTYGLEGAGYKMMCEYLQSDKREYLQQILRSDAINVAMRNILE
jgi:prephenate dehydrogenase